MRIQLSSDGADDGYMDSDEMDNGGVDYEVRWFSGCGFTERVRD